MSGYAPPTDDNQGSGGFPPLVQDAPDNTQPGVQQSNAPEDAPDFEAKAAQVAMPGDGGDLQFEVVEDLDPKDQGRPLQINPKAPTYEEAEHIPGLPDSVKKRFSALTAQAHISRRQAELAKKEAEAYRVAAELAYDQANRKNTQAYDASKTGVELAKQNATAQVEAAKKRLEDTYARMQNGESVAKDLAEAQSILAAAQSEAKLIESIPMSEGAPPLDQNVSQAWAYAQQARQEAVAAQQQAPYDPGVEEWVRNNSHWFGNNNNLQGQDKLLAKAMTATALELAQELSKKGVNDFASLDKELQRQYPEVYSRFNPGSAEPQRSAQPAKTNRAPSVPPVAGVNRQPATGGNRTYQLTKTQMQVCQDLNISPQAYLRQLIARGEV